MRTKWKKPGGLDEGVDRLATKVELQVNQEFWRWGGAAFETEPGLLLPDPEPEVGPVTDDPAGGEWPLPAAGGGGFNPGLAGEGPLDPTVQGTILWHIDTKETVLKIAIFTPIRTADSTSSGYLLCRLRNYRSEQWIGPALSSLEGEFGSEPREVKVSSGGEVEPGDTLGFVGLQIGSGPARGCRRFRGGVLFVRR